MLLWPLLLLLLLLLPTLALLMQQRSQDARLSWLAGLQHRVAWGALVWAATWQRWRLEQSTLHVHESQQQALRWCLQGAQRPHCSFTDISTFRNHLPLTKASQTQEEESGEQPLPPTSNQDLGEASLQADGEELAGAIAAGNPGAPLPERAAELREALEQGPRGLALRLWPKLQVVVTLDAGGQAEAVAALGALWCQGLAFFSPAYAASGGVLGLNLQPEQPYGLYLLPPGAPFIELLPVKEGTQEEAASTLLLTEAQQGKEYELVLTDHASLTRCRLGDVVRVVGVYNQCPVVRFIYRLGQTLSVRGEDIGEDLFSEALGRAVGQWPGAKLLDHGCVESSILDSSAGSAPHYEVFVALRGLRNLSEENRDKLDHCLQEASPRYKSLRFWGSVGPARVHLVGQGAFRALRAALTACPSSPFPPAMPRVLRHRHLAQCLQERVVS
ncbi:GH3 domain-containing protein isoform X3 [Macaca thibetana thibetana]|uniref:GH3 domain-containing protein isoform X3 n=1 Tax=Macaca thibetana thibetana TaxID=257877 RepID=UPI0021BC9FE5|nr:GH3 domain-containing protein isoform X3 [Macaca thibetana thibetana]